MFLAAAGSCGNSNRLVNDNLDFSGCEFEEGAQKPEVDLMYSVKVFENISSFVFNHLLDLPDEIKAEKAKGHLSTLTLAYISPGDMVYVPAGVLMIEKVLNANSISFRIPCTFVDELSADKIERVCKANQGYLALFQGLGLGLGVGC